MTPQTRVEPPKHLYQGHRYTPSHATNLRALFERIRQEQAKKS